MGCCGDKSDYFNVEKVTGDAVTAIAAVKGILIDKDPKAVEKYVADGYFQHNPGYPSGKDALLKLLETEFEYTVGQVAPDGEYLWMHSRIEGFGPEPMIAMDIFRFEEGLIAEHWDVMQPEVPANETVSGESMLTIDSDSPLVKALSK